MATKKAKASTSEPTSVTLRSFQVGFGDCFLLTFNYGEDAADDRRHVLIDFGSTAQPKRGAVPMTKIADEIKEICKGKLHAVVATHRHRDHISGFGGKPGKSIASLNPDVVVQPWTEHPNAARGAKEAPEVRVRAKGFMQALGEMHAIAESSLKEIQTLRTSATVRNQLRFLGDDNLANRAAIDTLMGMKCTHTYVNHGSKSGLESVLPGVKIHVLGPPNLTQSRAIEKQTLRGSGRVLAPAGRGGAGASPRRAAPSSHARARSPAASSRSRHDGSCLGSRRFAESSCSRSCAFSTSR